MKKTIATGLLLSALVTMPLPTHAEDCSQDAEMLLSNYIINPNSTHRRDSLISLRLPKTVAISKGTYKLLITPKDSKKSIVLSKNNVDSFLWNGKNIQGKPVPDGVYSVEFTNGMQSALEEIVVDSKGIYDRLFAIKPGPTPLNKHKSPDSSFPYSFYYGCTHAHSIYSDGGVPCATCKGSEQKPHNGASPAQAYTYAKGKGKLDFLAITEHNHLMDNVCKDCSKQAVIQRYHDSLLAANKATEDGTFVGLYGMEWGTIAPSTGHINIYNSPKLISWNIPDGNSEPADISIGKNDYTALYKQLSENQADSGTYATFNHPGEKNFDNWKHTAEADKVMRGLAVISGPSDSKTETFDKNQGHDYTQIYEKALLQGWKVAPEAHQDNHCWNYGTASTNRTVVLIPQDQPLSQKLLLDAINNRRFYATQDMNLQLLFRTKDGQRIMGESFDASTPITLKATVKNADGEPVRSMELWSGKVGSSNAKLISSTNMSNELEASLAPAPQETWFYYVRIHQIKGSKTWSAPIWISWK